MTNYPSQLDTDAELPAVVDNITEIGGEAINAIRDALIIIEKTLGTNPQGSAATLAARLSESFNDDGSFKESALSASGLVSLPIDNSQIGASAGIVESKLNLDVATQSLQNQISSNDIDIIQLWNAVNTVVNNLVQHTLGFYGRHDGYQIDLSLPLLGVSSTVGTVEEALEHINTRFLNHKATRTVGEHFADAITYEPITDGAVQEDNVQDAIASVDSAFVEDRRKHNDSAHSDGISADGYVFLGGQAATNDASGKLSRYQTFGGSADIMKIGLLNAASIKTKGFNPVNINSSNSAITIEVLIGTGITRTLAITGLHNAAYPSGIGRVTLDGVVDYLNTSFANTSNNFPVQAYSSNGELVLQHNIASVEATIKVVSPGVNSAIDALGFTDIAGREVGPASSIRLVVNGKPFDELKTVVSGSATLGVSNTIVNLGVDVTSSGLDLQDDILIHILNHTTDSANGTYHVITGQQASTSIELSTTLTAGTFEYVIYADTFNTALIGSPRALDFYIDENRNPITSDRGAITFGGITGIKIVEISQDFPAASGSITMATSGTNKVVSITIGSNTGESTTFETGFIGYIKVFAPDNVAYVTILVFDPSPVSGTDTFIFIATEANDDRLFLGTTHFDASAVLEIPMDRRNVGLVGNTSVGTEFRRDVLEADLDNLHLNGLVRGFDIVSSTTSNAVINGGIAYIAGQKIEKTRETVEVIRTATTVGTWNLVLTKSSNYEIYLEGDAGLSVDDVLAGDDAVLIAQFTIASGPTISDTADARFFINDLESKLPLTVDDRDLGAGNFRTLEAAALYSQYAPNDTKPEITVLSDLTESGALTIATGIRVIAFGDITVSGALTLSTDAELIVYGTFTAGSTITLGTRSMLEINGEGSVAGDITVGNNATLKFDDTSAFAGAASVLITGDDAVVAGKNSRPTLTFATTSRTAAGIVVSGYNAFIDNLDLVMDYATFACVDLGFGADRTTLTKCRFSQGTELGSTELAQYARCGVSNLSSGVIRNLTIADGYFTNLGSALYSTASSTFQDLMMTGCDIHSCGAGVYAGPTVGGTISHCTFTEMRTRGIAFQYSSLSSYGINLNNNYFYGIHATSTTFSAINIASTVSGISVINNVIRSVDSGTGTLVFAVLVDDVIFSGNIIDSCSSDSTVYAVYLTGGQNCSFVDNMIVGHAGRLIRAEETNVSGNVFASSSSTGNESIYIEGNNATRPGSIFANNKVEISSTDEYIYIEGCTVVGNRIRAPYMTLNAIGQGFLVSDNTLDLTSTSVTSAIDVSVDASTDINIFSNNMVIATATDQTLNLPGGKFLIADNIFKTDSGLRAIDLGNGSVSANNMYVVSDNLIQSGSNEGILVDGYNSSITDNIIHGTVANGDIVVANGVENIMITGNSANGSGGDARRIYHQTSSPQNCFIGINKNARSSIVYSSLNGLQDGSWTLTNDLSTSVYLSSSSSSTLTLIVPLHGLPTGAELESVDVYANCGGAGSGALNIQLFRRGPTSNLTTDIGPSSGQDSASGTFQTISISPSNTEYVRSTSSYFVVLTSTASGIRVGQVIAHINY